MKGNAEILFGFLNCNKPAGMTSRDVVNSVQRRLPRKTKVGHAGTLDPLAEGVLILGVGPAVRLVPYLQQLPKHYHATFRLGQSSQSGDLEGEQTLHPGLAVPSADQIRQAASQLVGTIEQTPPAHSAIWVDGQRAYKRARAGEAVEMPKRTVHIESLKVLRYEYPELEFETVCGSGTYIRTLGIDLAVAAGSTAVMTHLVRTAIGPFSLSDSLNIQSLREGDLASLLVPAANGVQHLPHCTVSDEESTRLGHGLCIEGSVDKPEVAAVTQTGCLRAILKPKRGQLCPHRVFPLPNVLP